MVFCKIRFFVLGLLVLTVAPRCKTDSSSKKITQATKSVQPVSNNEAADFEIGREYMTVDLVKMKIIDTTVTTELGEACYCDTTLQLNDSVSYSIISANDEPGVCTYFFLASMNKKAKKVIASTFLCPDCDVDYSSDIYDLYEHKIVSQEKLQVTKTTIFQKKKRTSTDEDKNIDHKHTQYRYITISQTGQITTK